MRNIYIREEVCMGCGLCRIYCQMAHSESKDLIKSFKKETPRPLPRIRVERKGEVCFAVQCRHCDKPWCIYSCLTGAMHREPETGVVAIDKDKCMGCWTCMVACPYGALTKDSDNKIAAKCDFCPDYDIPVCVANCPNEALILSEEEIEEASPDLVGVK